MRSLARNPDIYESPLPVGLMDEDEVAQVRAGPAAVARRSPPRGHQGCCCSAQVRKGLSGEDSALGRLGRRYRGLLHGWERRD
jgi:hypothetical protein